MNLLIIPVSGIIGYSFTTGVKSQTVRLVDILFFGPFLIWLGYREKDITIKNI